MPDWDVDIKEYKDLPEHSMTVSKDPIGSDTFLEYSFEGKKVSISEKHHMMYQEALNPKKTWGDRIRNFFKAENDLGRGFKVVKDFALLFAPKWVNVGYDTVDEFVIQNIFKDMSNEESKSASKSSTVITFGLLFLVGLLMQLGFIPPEMVELSPDAQWVATASGAIGVILRVITDKPVKLGKSLRRLLGRKSG